MAFAYLTFLFIVLIMVSHPASAKELVECTDLRIAQLICGDVAHPVIDRRDDTGFGKTMEDIDESFTRLSSKDVSVSLQAFERFIRTYENVIQAYQELSQDLPFALRTWMKIRLAKLAKPPTREDLKANRLFVFLQHGGSTYLIQDDYAKLSAFVLNKTDLSETELFMLISHEIGHGLDPEAYFKNVRLFRSNRRVDVVGKEVQACFLKGFPKSSSPSPEDYADWLSSNALTKFIESARLSTD